MWLSSSSAANAAACATDDTENVFLMRAQYPSNSAGPRPYPTRRPASPCALENVRSTTTLAPLANILQRVRVGDSPQRREVQRKFVVSLIQHHHHMAGNLRQKALHHGRFQHGAGRVVGVCQKNDARLRVDCGENCFQIETVVAHRRFDQTARPPPALPSSRQ